MQLKYPRRTCECLVQWFSNPYKETSLEDLEFDGEDHWPEEFKRQIKEECVEKTEGELEQEVATAQKKPAILSNRP